MAWYGMVWYGMVWYGMVWYGMVWYYIYRYLFFIDGTIANESSTYTAYEMRAPYNPEGCLTTIIVALNIIDL